MGIQIFGKKKCFDTKKAERFFSERRVPVQYVDILRFGLSQRETESVLRAVGGVDALIDWDCKHPDVLLLRYTESVSAKLDKLAENPALLKTPIVRNGKQATVGYCPDIWRKWLE